MKIAKESFHFAQQQKEEMAMNRPLFVVDELFLLFLRDRLDAALHGFLLGTVENDDIQQAARVLVL